MSVIFFVKSLGDFMQKIKNLKAIPSDADLVIDNLAVFN